MGGWLEKLGIRLSQLPTKLKLKLKLSLAISLYFIYHLFAGAFLSCIPITLLTQNNIVTLLMYSHPGIKYLLNISEHFFLVTVSINLGVEEIINTVG